MDELEIDQLGDYLEHNGLSDDEIDEVLAHFGVKGMKWGVRRDNRANLLVKVGKKRGDDGFDRFRAGLDLAGHPIDLIKGRGLRGGSLRRGERLLARNKRVREGNASIKDFLLYYGGTKTIDFLPTRRGRNYTGYAPATDAVDKALRFSGATAITALLNAN